MMQSELHMCSHALPAAHLISSAPYDAHWLAACGDEGTASDARRQQHPTLDGGWPCSAAAAFAPLLRLALSICHKGSRTGVAHPSPWARARAIFLLAD